MSIRPENKICHIGGKHYRRIIIFVSVLLLGAAALPLFVVEIPALGDYLNHLARMNIIATVDKDPRIARFYTVTWHVIPNLAMDLVIPVLSRFIDIYLAGKLFVFMTIALIMTGTMALNYAVFRRITAAPLITSLFIYNLSLLLGLLNYLAGVGIALWGVAVWIWLHERPPLPRAMASLCFLLVLFLCHFEAVGLYGLTLICFEGWQVSTAQNKGRRMISDALVMGLPFLFVLLCFMATRTMELTSVNIWTPLRLKLRAIEWMFELYHPAVDYSIVGLVGAAALWGLWRRILRVHPVGWVILCAGIAVYTVMPDTLSGCLFADYRFPIAIMFLLISFSCWELSIPAARLITSVIVGLALVRFTLVGMVWLDIDRVYVGLRNAFNEIRPGSAILVGRTERIDFPFNRFLPFKICRNERVDFPFSRALPLNYAACLATIDRSAFVPNLFTKSGIQILTVKPEFRDMEMDPTKVAMPSIRKFILALQDPATAHAQGFQWAEWDKRFDYLLLFYTNDDYANPLPRHLTALASGYQFHLYRIRR